MQEPAEVVRAYLDALFADPPDETRIARLLDDDVEIIEHPNAIARSGNRRDRAGALEGVRAGRAMMAWQSLEDVRYLTADETVVVRAVWRGALAQAVGGMPAQGRITADVAMFFQLRNGRILRQENYDCYQPLPDIDPRPNA